MIEIYERKITSWVRFSLNQILETGYIYIHTGTVSSVTVKPDFKNKHDLDIYDLR